MMLWLGLALAADPASYPLEASVTLPPAGPARIVLAGDAVGADPSLVTAGLLLLDRAGNDLPYAVVPSDNPEPETDSLFARPAGRFVWEIEAASRPIDRLSLDFDDLALNGPFRASLEVWSEGGWRTIGTPEVLYRYDDEGGAPAEDRTLDAGHLTGPFRVTVERLGRGVPDLDFVHGEVLPPTVVPPLVEHLDAPSPSLTEDGMARYVVALPGPRQVTSIRLGLEGDLFSREVRFGTVDPQGQPVMGETHRVRRIAIADARVDLVDISGLDLRGDTLVIDIATDRGRVLPLTGVDVSSPAVDVLVRDVGVGPHRLLLGGREEARTYDLGVGAYELLRLDPPRVVPGAPTPNAEYLPRPTREGLDAVGGEINLARYKWAREVAGAGWVKVVLDRAALAHAKVDLSDLRVVDAAGHQVPFLFRRSRVDEPLPVGAFTREERGTQSLLRVPLGEADAPVETVTIETGADVFRRDVYVDRDRGRMTETLRHVEWSGEASGQRLTLTIGDRVGSELLLRVDNGDNPPLPITAITATSPAWELAFRVPEGGARVVYGSARAERPWYDLSMLEEEVRRIPLTAATLGPEVALAGPTLDGFDKVVVLAAVGALTLGLVAMTIRVLRAVPEAGDQEPSASR